MPIEQTSPLGPWPEGILPVHCSGCRLPLCISMPRGEFPERLVGTCVGCWSKYVITWTADGTEALIGRLPDERTTRPIPALPDFTHPLMISGLRTIVFLGASLRARADDPLINPRRTRTTRRT